MTRARPRPRAFALLTGLVLLGLVGVALAAMSALFAQQARRTTDARRDAQLRQLLLASAVALEDRCAAWPAEAGEQAFAVALPKPLADNGASLSIQIRREPASTQPILAAHVEARFQGQQLRQTLDLSHSAGRWHITGARLGE